MKLKKFELWNHLATSKLELYEQKINTFMTLLPFFQVSHHFCPFAAMRLAGDIQYHAISSNERGWKEAWTVAFRATQSTPLQSQPRRRYQGLKENQGCQSNHSHAHCSHHGNNQLLTPTSPILAIAKITNARLAFAKN